MSPRLSIIPAGAIFDRRLEPRDLQVLNLLGCHTDKAGWCRRSQVRMASELDCSRSSVQRSLDRLCDAGWVQKKRAPWSSQDGQPSASYMYRVVLDRDEAEGETIEDSNDEAVEAESHAETAGDETECPPVGTPQRQQGAQPDGHPGAQPYVGTGAQPYVGTKNDPLERPLVEREREARARDRNARFIVDFEKRWPTAAADDRQRTAYAAEALTEDEQAAALAGIAGFLDHLKQHKRRNVPAGWRYLEEKRWTLLAEPQAAPQQASGFPLASPEGRAVTVLYDIAGLSSALSAYMVRDGKLFYRLPVGPRLLALADAPPSKTEWVQLTRQQAGAWDTFLRDTVPVQSRRKLAEGALAPWPWPPSTEGKVYATPPPEVLMTEDDCNAI